MNKKPKDTEKDLRIYVLSWIKVKTNNYFVEKQNLRRLAVTKHCVETLCNFRFSIKNCRRVALNCFRVNMMQVATDLSIYNLLAKKLKRASNVLPEWPFNFLRQRSSSARKKSRGFALCRVWIRTARECVPWPLLWCSHFTSICSCAEKNF